MVIAGPLCITPFLQDFLVGRDFLFGKRWNVTLELFCVGMIIFIKGTEFFDGEMGVYLSG